MGLTREEQSAAQMGLVELGLSARALWSFAPDVVPLNHGSFGACPRYVQAAQNRIKQILEDCPDRFFDDFIVPDARDTPLRCVIARLAQLVDAPQEQLALVENTTTAIDCVLRSMDFGGGDRILMTSHAYGAVRLAAECLCRAAGAVLDIIPIPLGTTDKDVVAQIAKGIRGTTRLLIVDHIASVSARIFPIEAIVARCRSERVKILVDGAHAIGQLRLSLRHLGADWYVTNLHKWLFAPRGACLLFAGAAVSARTRPSIVSHYIELGFPRSFDFIGTRDYSPWLSIPTAIEFHDALGHSRSAAHADQIIAYASERLWEVGAQPLGAHTGAMRSFLLPQKRDYLDEDSAKLRDHLWRARKIQAFTHSLDGQFILRISAAPYVGREDIDSLFDALHTDGWPGQAAMR